MIKIIVQLVLILAMSGASFAQEMYLSISGSGVEVESGDNRNQYDIWIKPESDDSLEGYIQIFDAGLGGAVDLITQGIANTSTNFSIFEFNDLYSIDGNTLTSKNFNGSAISSIKTKNEERFKNRWIPLSKINSISNGYIIRVSTDNGDDVNSFNLRVVSNDGMILSQDVWKIITIDLSIGVYASSKNTMFQLKPYFNDSDFTSPSLIINGEEDSEARKIDSFGNTYPINENQLAFSKFGHENKWGLQITGSTQKLNTLTIFGVEAPVLWEFEPIALSESTIPELAISEVESRSACTDKTFELSGNFFTNSDLDQTQWILNDNQIATGARPTISFNERGQVPIEILIPNNRSYYPEYWAYQQIVFVNTPPVASLISPKQIISPSEVLTLSGADSYDIEGQDIEYTWLVNGTQRSNEATYSFYNTISGLYDIMLQVSDGGTAINCSVTDASVTIRVNTQPYAEIVVPSISGTDEPINFTVQNVYDSDNDQITYLWEGLGIEANSTEPSITISHSQPGVYPVRLTINDNTGADNEIFTINRVYEINAAPEPRFNIDEFIAPGDIITLNAIESSDPNVDDLTYTWLLDDKIIANTDISTLTLDAPGDYEITLRVDDQRGASNSVQSLSRNIRVNAPPRPIISAVPVTSKALVDFAANQSSDIESEIQSYLWDFGDGNTASGPQVSHTYLNTGTYTVKLTVDDGASLANSIQSSEHVLLVNSYPEALFEAPSVIAPNQPFTVDGSSSSDIEGQITNYEWMINGKTVGNGSQTTITLESSGLHTISLSVMDDSGFEEAKGFSSKLIRVNQSPVARWRTDPISLIPNTEINFIAEQSFDNDGVIKQYLWKFEDGTEIEGETIQHFFREGGKKRFTLTVTDNDGLNNSTTTVEGMVSVNHQPDIITENMVRSNTLDVRLDASKSYDLDNDALFFEWTLPDGTNRRESTFTWRTPKPGVHFVGLTVDDGLGLENSIAEESITVMINRPVEAVVDSMIASCTGQTVFFNSSQSYDPDGDVFSTSWDFGNGIVSDDANPTYIYETAGVYEAKLSLDDGFSGIPSIAKIPIIIEGSPVAKFNISENSVCVNSSITLDGTLSTDPSGSLPSFSWDLGDGNTAKGAKYEHVFTEPGTYTITLTVEGSGSGKCGNTAQTFKEITVFEGPKAFFELPTWIAPGEPVILDGTGSVADGGFKSATWIIDSDNNNSTQELLGLTTTHIFNESGEYFVTLNLKTNTNTDCNTVSLTKSIKVNAQPIINWTLQENIASGSDLVLDAFSSSDSDGFIQQFKWYIDDEFISNNATELVKAILPGRHKVTLVVTDNSSASNNFNTIDKYFFANSSPKPSIDAPNPIFQNQEVNLRSNLSQDADGDVLSTMWKLDGEWLESPNFRIEEARTYSVLLIQDDGRDLSNSVDSTLLEINPIQTPKINPFYTKNIAVDGIITILELGLGKNWAFMNQNFFESNWRARKPGISEFTLAWIPDGQVLSTTTYQINVVEPLEFTEQATPTIIEWNPINPTTMLTAPTFNRSVSDVSIIWKQNGVEIGRGLQISPKLIKGQNRFSVEVEDLKVSQSKPIRVNLIVTTQ